MAETMTARGVIVRQAGGPGVVEEFTIDAPAPGEAIVRILASGVCHTDLSARNGVFKEPIFPRLLGHEGSGIVERVGEGVTNVAPGDYVILAWRAPCGACRFCLRGQPQLCAARVGAHPGMKTLDGETLIPVLSLGTFCTHTLVSARQCIPVDPALPPEQMCLIGCGVMTGVGSSLYTANVQPGQSVAVIGCGGVGMSAIMGARLAGATTIIAVDLDAAKLGQAKAFGATHAVDAGDGDPVAAVKEITGGCGVNVAIEAVGRPETVELAIRCRDRAGTCVIVGVANPKATVTLTIAEIFGLGGSLRFSWYGECVPARDFPMLATWYAQGRLDLDRLITRVITLDETEDAFAAMERGETLRTVIRL